MKKLFYFGLLLLAAFEIMNVYFIMPMPGSQRMNSLDMAYQLYSWRWVFRSTSIIMILAGSPAVFRHRFWWLGVLAVIPVLVIAYVVNFSMTADHMFLQPENVVFKSYNDNVLTDSSIVVAVEYKQEAKAYPIRFIQYHHQVRDTIAGKPIMVTYCNVCRTGRVFEPTVDGKPENFRLVGMDHFNAMFEDETTRSWWRQATGEAVTGSLKGKTLPEVESNQYTLRQFFVLHPTGQVMQADVAFKDTYDSLARFEKGKSRSSLTRTDSLSWRDKSWVVGVQVGGQAKAYDWIELKKARIINDNIGSTPIVVAMASDDQSFAVFERGEREFVIRNDSLISASGSFDFAGRGKDGSGLKALRGYQEFWHSWQQFHPNTEAFKQ